MDNSKNSVLAVTGLLVMSAAMVAGLHSLGRVPDFVIDWSDPVAWLSRASAENAIAAMLRYAGLTTGYWLLISTGLCIVAIGRNPKRPPQWMRLTTLPLVRRTVERALATTLALSITAAPIGSLHAENPSPAPVVSQVVDDGIPVPHIRLTPDERPAEGGTTERTYDDGEQVRDAPADTESVTTSGHPDFSPAVPTTPRVAAAAAVIAHQPDPAATYTVERGDNLWSIAAANLEAATATRPTVDAIDRYWRSVVSANRGTLRSGDPNLIFPGEIITLPALEASP